jgi:hypothetical protein
MKNSVSLKVVLAAILCISALQACKFTFINDGYGDLTVVDIALKQSFQIAEGASVKVGDPDKHAHCLVFRANETNPLYEFKVIACASPKSKPSISVSELMAGKVGDIFQIVNNKPSENLAKVVTHCSKCSANKK